MSYLDSRKTTIVGADVFIVQKEIPKFASSYGRFAPAFISNRGAKIWPGPPPRGELVDVFRCRFILPAVDFSKAATAAEIIKLLTELEMAGFEWTHVEKLLVVNGRVGFSKPDGE